jgi:RNA recognition motif-containing protein
LQEAKRNHLRPIDYIRLGPECHVKYVGDSPSRPIRHRLCDERTIVIKNIPENVSENDLRRLFPNCYISKYCPARTVHRMATSTTVTNKSKTFWG